MAHQTRRKAADMVASDLMTEALISVTANASVQAVPQLLLESHVGGVPVTDASGNPIGMVGDGGRAIANVEEGWEKTLRAEAAELDTRWEHNLKPKGSGLEPPALSFANDRIGDSGLALTWAAEASKAAE